MGVGQLFQINYLLKIDTPIHLLGHLLAILQKIIFSNNFKLLRFNEVKWNSALSQEKKIK